MFGDPKIEHGDDVGALSPSGEKHVAGLDVAVDDASRMAGPQRASHVDAHLTREANLEPAAACDAGGERLALEQLQHDVIERKLRVAADGVDGDHRGMVGAGGGLRLAKQPLRARQRAAAARDLDRDLPAQLQVLGLVDGGHAAAAEQSAQAVAPVEQDSAQCSADHGSGSRSGTARTKGAARSDRGSASVPSAPAEWDVLVRAAVAGESAAWQRLQSAVIPQIARIARSHEGMRSRGLHAVVDDVNEVTICTLERIAGKDFRNLRGYLRQRDAPDNARPQSFDSWIYGATDYAIREHLRRRFGRRPAGAQSVERPRPSEREINTEATDVDSLVTPAARARAIGVTSALMMAKIIAYAEQSFSPDELRALKLHLSGMDLAQIAEACALSGPDAADKLVRKLNARLRYRFAP